VPAGVIVVNQLTSDTPLENLYSRTGKLLLLYEDTGDPLHSALADLYTRWIIGISGGRPHWSLIRDAQLRRLGPKIMRR
jgi:hypothetical protein